MTTLNLKVDSEWGRLSLALVNAGNSLPPIKDLGNIPYSLDYYDREKKFHPEDEPYDNVKVREQLAFLHNILQANGVELVHAQDVEHAYVQLFTRDLGFVIGDIFYFGRSRHAVRDIEKRGLEFLKELVSGYVEITQGNIEGGDIFLYGKKIFIGISRQTNLEGFRALESDLRPMGYSAIPVPLTQEALHLDCRFNMFSYEGAVLLEHAFTQEGIENIETHFKGEIFRLPDQERITLGTNFFMISPTLAIADKRNSRTNEVLDRHGINVIEMDYSEVTKLWGGPRCSVMPLYRY